MKCPICRSQRVRRSRYRGYLESALLALLFIRPFRCVRCNHRFFRLSLRSNPRAAPHLATRHQQRVGSAA